MTALAWYTMQAVIIREQGPESPLRVALRRDFKGKVSPFLYLTGIGTAFISPLVSDLIYAGVALMWLIPDRLVSRVAAPETGSVQPAPRL